MQLNGSSSTPPRSPAGNGTSWHEVFLNLDQAAASESVAQSVARGHSFLVLSDVATPSECQAISIEASAAADRERSERELVGLVRKQVDELVGTECVALCDSLLGRQLALIEAAAPSLLSSLFEGILDASPTSVFGNKNLVWSEGEPALNVYTPSGCFTPHTDDQSLTCLLNVSSPEVFDGGGTAFWCRAAAGGAERTPPTCHLAPPAGTALIFGGQVTHGAQPLLSGERIVLVASFSPDVTNTVAMSSTTTGVSMGMGAPAVPAAATVEDCSLDEFCAALTGALPGQSSSSSS
jgi:hypothetical protein